jgi:uncharacterized phiE125 gp8 family phage protein
MSAGLALPAVTMSEAQAFVRIETGEEEALLAGMVRSASALCEAFLNQVVVARDYSVEVPASERWTRLPVTPVLSILTVEGVKADGTGVALTASDYAVDVDSNGDGWVRRTGGPEVIRFQVAGRAGMAGDANAVPEPIRHGVLRLVAHLFASRDDGAGGEVPAAVTALWRPYRRMRLA